MNLVWKKSFAFLSLLAVCWAGIPEVNYDVIVVGGGPSGLSAASGLSRVLRSVVLFDSGEYRNNPTRRMHDVIGSDHVAPSEFREKARQQISFYNATTFVDGKVTRLERANPDVFRATVANGTAYTARKVILGIGVTDDLPDVPGLREAFGKGIFWCPWCDGFEHRDQSIGVLGNLSDAYDSVKEIHSTLNKDIHVFSNGTDSPAQINRIDGKNPHWQEVFGAFNITVNNKRILNITRIQNGNEVQNQAIHEEYDKFRVYFDDETFDERDAFIANYGTLQASDLPAQLGVGFLGSKLNTTGPGLRTTVPGVWGVGDANSDNSTNVVHAMSSGKTAAVYSHVEMATEELAQVGDNPTKRDAMLSDQSLHQRTADDMGNELEDIYRRLGKF